MEVSDKTADAIRAARMYYYQNMTTEAIAQELSMSRSTISRLLSFARNNGLVDIRIGDPNEHPQQLEQKIIERFKIKRVHVVPVPDILGEAEWLERVAQYAANYWNTIFNSNMILGIAWGTTTSTVSRHLVQTKLPGHCASFSRSNVFRLCGDKKSPVGGEKHSAPA
jgi:deoxyribonucleoside regulator